MTSATDTTHAAGPEETPAAAIIAAETLASETLGSAPGVPPRHRLSEVLGALAATETPRLLLSDLLRAFGDRAFGALMFVFAAPNILPLPPGSSSVLSAPLIVIAAQLAMGRRVLWLPQVFANRSMAMADFRRFVDKALPWIERAERLLRPRLPQMFGSLGDRMTGAVCFLLGVILFLPLLGGNVLPGIAVTLFALGLIERDGVAVIGGWIFTAVSLAVLAAVFGIIMALARAFFDNFGALIGSMTGG